MNSDGQGHTSLLTDALLAGVILLLGGALALAGSGSAARVVFGPAPTALRLEDGLGLLAATAGTVMVLWWALASVAALLAAALLRARKEGPAIRIGRWVPDFMQRLAVGALGVQLAALSLPLAPEMQPTPSPAAASSSSSPAADIRTADGPLPSEELTPCDSPHDSWGTNLQGPLTPMWQPLPPVSDPGPLTARPLRPPGVETPTGPAVPGNEPRGESPARWSGTVVVQRGDSLWTLTARRLGPTATDVEVAEAWPIWFAINRGTIGDDPNRILPGQILRIPVETSSG
ncbi:MAG: hypothetical protein JWO93_1397 [Micrococcaceae bacterium]|nr:hypothetical protein [Micrococcaceae bacterium]